MIGLVMAKIKEKITEKKPVATFRKTCPNCGKALEVQQAPSYCGLYFEAYCFATPGCVYYKTHDGHIEDYEIKQEDIK